MKDPPTALVHLSVCVFGFFNSLESRPVDDHCLITASINSIR